MMKITEALYKATQEYPYYAQGFAALTPVHSRIFTGGIPTIGVDKYWRIYWSEDALENFKYQVETVMCHELEHLLRDHSTRVKGRNFHRWNIATDAEINDDLDNLPENAWLPRSLYCEDGLTAETYYDHAPERQCLCCHGSGVNGIAADWEEGAPAEGDAVDSEMVAEQLRDAIASDIKMYVNQQGKVPSNVLMWAEARCEGKLPRISWKKYISKKLATIVHGASDFTYRKISRRQDYSEGALLPGKVAYRPTLSVIIDTSGSMTSYGDWAAGVLRDVTKMQADTTLIACDAVVHEVKRLKTWKDIMKVSGGGGTDMREGVVSAVKKGSDLILVITDGETPWPSPWPRNLVAVINKGTSISVKNGANV